MLRKVISVGTALAMTFCLTASAVQAASIGVNLSAEYNGGVIGAGEAAGVVPTLNWNNLNGVNSLAALTDDSGAATTATVDTTWSRYNATIPTGGSTGDQKLMSGGNRAVESQTVQILLQDLDSANLGTYDAYVYFATHTAPTIFAYGNVYASNDAGEYNSNANPAVALDTQSWSLPGGTAFNGTWTEGTNYVKFTGLSEDTLMISVDVTRPGGDFSASHVAGVQLVGTAAVPEPSTFALAGIGLVGLAGFGLRRRRKNA